MSQKIKLAFVFVVFFIVGIAPWLLPLSYACSHDNGWKKYDLNKDGKVNIYDMVIFSAFYGLKQGHPYFWSKCDFNGDGVINIFDMVALATHYGYPKRGTR